MLPISPRQLQVFVQVVAGGSLRAAADALHMTQPAASMALAEMEKQLGAPLFDRERGRLRLNPHGRELLPLAQELLERHAELGRVAASGGTRLTGGLRIGTSALATRGFGDDDFREVADIIAVALSTEFTHDRAGELRGRVHALTEKFPLYPNLTQTPELTEDAGLTPAPNLIGTPA